ncbi:FtsX-like permease family protein [Clostridium septicum]|uniref:ABC transporter permease n=1 Tax=Clostridium septicum TaxID=1504 RepID=A0A9N7PJV7_CLOSE|nr:FtsX-like permease family protein [Clostridium septicum]AYE35216.1 ABC transporter permease [Clostridium septicum]MDU1313636.1 FtsX-like permease family protein [Clostridium septicum]UEC20132.1 FtsX-like permease family protein [Clostridium septicum]USS01811.1 FtsX-like permease family protein [Clostridium septicum]WLF70383.1 FtsX-like permease family protein [Clostridium septicum]
MKNSMYFNIANNNLRKNKKTYIPYILACIGTIMMFYIMNCIATNEGLDYVRGAGSLKILLGIGVKIIGLFSIIFLFYTNSFLIKRRKKEIGLYNVLGMEKKHIGKILTIETLMIGFGSLIIGIILGTILGKLLFLILINLLKVNINLSSTFSISLASIKNTLFLFIPIFAVVLLQNIIMVKVNNPIELLKGGEKGEKEPKASLILTICAFGFLIVGYTMASTVDKPLKALSIVFIAIILVILGTYSLFTSGSIAILKLLKKNKSFYYKSKNFISVSGMIYRMKQNAVGLASICILCTAVLITISTTVSLYAGQDGSLKIAYPYETQIKIPASEKELYTKISEGLENKASDHNVKIIDLKEFNNFNLMVKADGENFKSAIEEKSSGIGDISVIQFYLLDDYNKIENKNIELKDDEALIFSISKEYNSDSIVINDNKFKIAKNLDSFKVVNKNENNITDEYCLVLKNQQVIENVCKDASDKGVLFSTHEIKFNLDGIKEDKIKFCESISSNLTNNKLANISNIDIDRKDFYVVNGGFIFLGSFLGLLFILATVLIIYYKQISEGYDDSDRFQIMKKVGMSKEELKKVINKQVLMVFFFPVGIALIHTAFAFKPISKLLGLFGLFDINIFLIVTIIIAIVFIILYVIVYAITSNVYYKVVQQE